MQGTLSGATSPTGGYRDRSTGEPGVRGSLSNPASTSTRRQPGAVTPTSGAAAAAGASRRVASDQAAASRASRGTSARGDRAAGSQQVSMGTSRRQTNAQGYRAPLRGAGAGTASGDMARRSGGAAAGSYSGRAGDVRWLARVRRNAQRWQQRRAGQSRLRQSRTERIGWRPQLRWFARCVWRRDVARRRRWWFPRIQWWRWWRQAVAVVAVAVVGRWWQERGWRRWTTLEHLSRAGQIRSALVLSL